jgi:cytochrome b subunit of formate dehydrogenase
MSTGRVDENFAKQHHSDWYEEAREEGTQTSDAGEEANRGAARGEPA